MLFQIHPMDPVAAAWSLPTGHPVAELIRPTDHSGLVEPTDHPVVPARKSPTGHSALPERKSPTDHSGLAEPTDHHSPVVVDQQP